MRDVAAAPAIDTALATGDTLFVFIEGSPSVRAQRRAHGGARWAGVSSHAVQTEDSRAAFAKVAAMWQDRLVREGTPSPARARARA